MAFAHFKIIPRKSPPYIIRFYSVDARQEIGLAKFDYCEGTVCETLPSECVDKLAEKINRVRSRRIIGIAHDLSCPDAIKLKRLNQLFHAQNHIQYSSLLKPVRQKTFLCSTEWIIGCMEVIIIFLVDFLSLRDFKNYRPFF